MAPDVMPAALAWTVDTDSMAWLWLPVAMGIILVALYGLLILLARRLPPGIARDLAAFIPDCVTTIRRLRRDSRVPPRARLALLIALAWVLSPIDLIPEFIPVIGPLDDIVVVALCLRYAARRIPRGLLLEAWPGESKVIERLLGPRADVRFRPPHPP